MKVFLHFSFGAALVFSLALSSAGQSPCAQVSVLRDLEVSAGEFSLADLLEKSCPAFREAAMQVVLGKAPLAGDPRIFAGDQLRRMLLQVSRTLRPQNTASTFDVPERVTVRGAEEHRLASNRKTSMGKTPALVVPGQPVMLIWEQEGIRVVLAAICLDRGAPGDAVRVRARNSGKIWWAQVAQDGMLRAIL